MLNYSISSDQRLPPEVFSSVLVNGSSEQKLHSSPAEGGCAGRQIQTVPLWQEEERQHGVHTEQDGGMMDLKPHSHQKTPGSGQQGHSDHFRLF